MVRTQIQLTEEQAAALRKLAADRHQSIAELVRQAVNAVIRTDMGIGDEERRRRALSVVGKYRSGKRDISRKHDSYLAEAFSK